MTKNSSRPCRNERAVSPVVGVMLMLVVVIIIAAIVSGFAGGLVGGGSAKKAPTLAMDVKVVNTGYWQGSGFFATVTGVSDPIPTKDLRIVTSWKARERYNSQNSNEGWGADQVGNFMTGGSTVVPNGSSNINVLFTPSDPLAGYYAAPLGTGPGVNGTEGIDITRTLSAPGQQFGNYTLMQGTTLSARPAGAKDAASLGSSGQANSIGGYGASNASYTVWVPETTSKGYCHRWNSGNQMTDKEYNSSSSPTCADTLNATSGWTMGTSEAYCKTYSGKCFYVEPGTTTPGHDQTVDGTKGRKYLYTNCGGGCIDPAKTVLGTTWYNLKWGDTVNVKVIHIPTGKVIFQQDVPVTE